MLTWGTFGAGSPAGRRYHFRSGLALAAVVVCILGSAFVRATSGNGILAVILAVTPGFAFAYIAWEFQKYLSSLDELARRIQLESIAWTYLCGLAAAMLLGGSGLTALSHGGISEERTPRPPRPARLFAGGTCRETWCVATDHQRD
jgi:hypothetical protein